MATYRQARCRLDTIDIPELALRNLAALVACDGAVGLVECGAHVVVAAEVAPCGRSEQAMAAQRVPAKLRPDRLVLADHNFYGSKLWQIACASGAKLVWRVKSNLKLPVQQMLSDGSYLSTVFDRGDRPRIAGQVVRERACSAS